MWRITGWPFDVIRRQSLRDLKFLTEALDVIDWHGAPDPSDLSWQKEL